MAKYVVSHCGGLILPYQRIDLGTVRRYVVRISRKDMLDPKVRNDGWTRNIWKGYWFT